MSRQSHAKEGPMRLLSAWLLQASSKTVHNLLNGLDHVPRTP